MEPKKEVSEFKYIKTSKLPSCYLSISDFEVLYGLIHFIYANENNIDIKFDFTFIYKKNLQENLKIENSKNFTPVEKALENNMPDSIHIYVCNSSYNSDNYKNLDIDLYSGLKNKLSISSKDRAWAEFAEQNIKQFFLQRKNSNWIFYNYFVISVFIYLPTYLSLFTYRPGEITPLILVIASSLIYTIYWVLLNTVIKRYFPITHIIKSDKDKTISKIAKQLIIFLGTGLAYYFLGHFFQVVFERKLHIF
jgi:hypothetical protein